MLFSHDSILIFFIAKFKVARRTVNKKATAIVQPKVECAEKSMNNVTVDLDEKMGCLIGTTISSSATLTGLNPQCGHDSHSVSGTHIASTNTSVPAHLLAHYNYQNTINPDELRGMIAGMAAMAAQSNAVCLCTFYECSGEEVNKKVLLMLLECGNIFKNVSYNFLFNV